MFLDLVSELERQGIERRVSGDLFGLERRTYKRKVQQLNESSTDRRCSLCDAMLDYICEEKVVTHTNIRLRFAGDDSVQVRSVLRDLCDAGLVFSTGRGQGTVYRATSEEDLHTLREFRIGEGIDELLWAIVYREGPVTLESLGALTHMNHSDLERALTRLVGSSRVERVHDDTSTVYRTSSLLVPIGSPVGWEAAIFDHFHAMVKTICCRLRDDPAISKPSDVTGGSTYTLDVWPGHPLAEETCTTLSKVRTVLTDLQRRVEEHNHAFGIPEQHDQAVLYVGQCVSSQGIEGSD
jgi:hypothetical protein